MINSERYNTDSHASSYRQYQNLILKLTKHQTDGLSADVNKLIYNLSPASIKIILCNSTVLILIIFYCYSPKPHTVARM